MFHLVTITLTLALTKSLTQTQSLTQGPNQSSNQSSNQSPNQSPNPYFNPNPKVWDLSSASMLYQSPIISAHSFSCLAFDSTLDRLALGTTDGKVRNTAGKPGPDRNDNPNRNRNWNHNPTPTSTSTPNPRFEYTILGGVRLRQHFCTWWM